MRAGSIAVLLASVLAAPDTASAEEKRGFTPRRVVREFPPIKDPQVIAASKVKTQVRDNELVLGVAIGKAARAYPINMLTGPAREIINDTLGGRAIAATW